MYGLHDASIPAARADEIVNSVFQLFHKSISETILKEEFVNLLQSGGDLPDCEFDGHHGDEEWEVNTLPPFATSSTLLYLLYILFPGLMVV